MSAGAAWAFIGLSTLITVVIKAVGPVALGGRDLPARFSGVLALMAPALLAALVVTQVFADGTRLGVGGDDTVGVAAAGVALWRGAPVPVGVVIAAVITAGLRAL